MKQKVLITAALPYANGLLHFGHIAGAYLPADCYAKFQRFIGADVLFVCGSDEYGAAITLSAEQAGRTPKEHVDYYHTQAKAFFEHLNFEFDHYSRTTWEGHREVAQQFFLDLHKNGYIEQKTTKQPYSEKDNRFLADRYVIGSCPKCNYPEARGDECPKCGESYEASDLKDPRSKLTGAPLIFKPTSHWFFRLDLFKEPLMEWIESKNWKPAVINMAKRYIEDARPRSITRDLEWGVPVPLEGAENKVFYVWFDAPIGYISASKEWADQKGDPDKWKDYWCDPNTRLVQFIGKDNIPFHAVFFPAMLMGQNEQFKLVDELPANEFYNFQGRKFSKSEGWTIDTEDFFRKYSADEIRYAIARNAPETSDSEFNWKDFQTFINSELLAKFGNLANRVLVFTQKQNSGKVPKKGVLDSEDLAFLNKISQLMKLIEEAYQGFHLRKACGYFMELAQIGNGYFDAKKPWLLAKNPDGKEKLQPVLYSLFECLKCLSIAAYPVIPNTAFKLWHMIGYTDSLTDQHWHERLQTPIPTGKSFPDPKVLFTKIEDKDIEMEITQLKKQASQACASLEALKESISFEDFMKLDLRVGRIIEAQPLEKAKKLVHLTVDIGLERRSVVAGIKQFYRPEELVGKSVVVVANLEPKKIMGITSHGMLLAANSSEGLELVSVKEAFPGSIVA